MENLQKFISIYRKITLIIFKLLFIIISIYYMLNYKKYSLVFNIPASIRNFPIINIPISFIENISLWLIIIPLTIVILSLVYREERWLQILSNILTLGGNLFSISHLYSKGLLEESFNLLFFRIYNVPSFEEKKNLFDAFFHEQINTYRDKIKDIPDFTKFCETVLQKKWTLFQNTLEKLSLADTIEFAKRSADDIYVAYIQMITKHTDKTQIIEKVSGSSSGFDLKTIVGVGIFFIVVGGLYYLIMKNLQFARENAQENLNNAVAIKKNTEQAIASDNLSTTTNESITDVANAVSTVASHVQRSDGAINQLTEIVQNHATILQNSIRNTTNMFKSLGTKLDPQGSSGADVATIKKYTDELLGVMDQMNSMVDQTMGNTQNLSFMTQRMLALEEQVLQINSQLEFMKEKPVVPQGLSEDALVRAAEVRLINNGLQRIQDFNPNPIISTIKRDSSKYIETLIAEKSRILQEAIDKKADSILNSNKIPHAVGNRMNELDSKTKALDGKTNELDSKTNELDGKLNTLDDKMKVVDSDVSSIHTLIKGQRDNLDALTSTVVEFNTYSKTFDNKLTEVSHAINRTNDEQTVQNGAFLTQLQSLKEEDKDISTKLQSAMEQNKNISAQLQSLIEQNKGFLSSFNEKYKRICTDLYTLRGAISKINKDNKDIDGIPLTSDCQEID